MRWKAGGRRDTGENCGVDEEEYRLDMISRSLVLVKAMYYEVNTYILAELAGLEEHA